MTADSIDYDGLMQANLLRVFGAHDAGRRFEAIRENPRADQRLNDRNKQ
jgi:hypothetical protein